MCSLPSLAHIVARNSLKISSHHFPYKQCISLGLNRIISLC